MGKQNLEKELKIAKELTEHILKELKIAAKVGVKEEDKAIQINIDGDELGLLIGYHGENLEALQLILGLMINKKAGGGEWIPINLDVGKWRADRMNELRSMVEKAASEIGVSKETVELLPMPASQRRMVHLILSDFPNLTSISEGEEPNRRVVIKKTETQV